MLKWAEATQFLNIVSQLNFILLNPFKFVQFNLIK